MSLLAPAIMSHAFVRRAPEERLSLDFVNQSYYSYGTGRSLLEFIVDVSRPSSKWVWGGGVDTGKLVEVPPNEPAYKYDPVTGAPLGLSVEGSAVNTFAFGTTADQISLWEETGVAFQTTYQSEGYDFGQWTVTNPTSADGTTGVLIRGDIVSGNTYTYQLVIESDDIDQFRIRRNSGSTNPVQAAIIDVSTATVVSGDAANIEVIKIADRRVLVSFNADATATGSFGYYVKPNDNKTGTFNFSLAAPQVELGTKRTSVIIKPTSTARTRAADIVTSDAATFGDWFTNPSQGSLYFSWSDLKRAGLTRLFYLSDGTDNNRIAITVFGSGSNAVSYTVGGVNTNISPPFEENGDVRIDYDGSFVRVSTSSGFSQTEAVTGVPSGISILEIASKSGSQVSSLNAKELTFKPEATL